MNTLSIGGITVVRPRFWLKFQNENHNLTLSSVNDGVSGSVDNYDCYLPKNCRYISIAELDKLMSLNHWKSKQILAEHFLAYLLARGVDIKPHFWHLGIWMNEGIRREGNEIIVFKNITNKIESVSDASGNSMAGYKIKKAANFNRRAMNLQLNDFSENMVKITGRPL